MSFIDAIRAQEHVPDYIEQKSGYESRVKYRPSRQISDEKKARIMQLVGSGKTQTQIARQTGVSLSVVNRLANGKYGER